MMCDKMMCDNCEENEAEYTCDECGDDLCEDCVIEMLCDCGRKFEAKQEEERKSKLKELYSYVER